MRSYLRVSTTILLFASLAFPVTGRAEPSAASPAVSGSGLTVGWSDAVVTGTALAAALVPYAFASRLINPRCPCSPDELSGFDRWAVGRNSKAAVVVSDLLVLGALGLPVLLQFPGRFTPEFWEDMIIYSETLAISAALVSLTKVAVQRPLPSTYAGDPESLSSSEGYRSFYSGHVTTAMTALVAWARIRQLRSGESPAWPWVLAGVTAAGVGLLRIEAGKHFPTDVLVGALAGVAIGYVVPSLHRAKGDRGATVMLVPVESGATAMVAWRL